MMNLKGMLLLRKKGCILFHFVLLWVIMHASPAAWADESIYIKQLVNQARHSGLAKDPYWFILLHYKQGLSGFRSLVDDPKFFLSPLGKSNPDAELEATIRAFFQPLKDEAKHPVCRFVARFSWLKEKLNIDPAKLPLSECGRFNTIMKEMQPEAVSLIFPAAHINSPASMFGHTLLTVDTAHHTRLLAYAVNYTAVTNETFGPLFAVKGIFGLYPGYFSIMPYYTKLQEYNDIEQRDIWEYRLNLNREEIRRLLMHAYEMDQIYADYYFFDENCSYVLFFLLDAARPDLWLTGQCSPWVIPLDTIRVVQQNGLVVGVTYRPSRATKIQHLSSLLTEEDRKMARSIALGEWAPERILSLDAVPERKIVTTDLASEYLQYRYATKNLTNEAFSEHFLKILKVRSQFGGAGEGDYEIPIPKRPDEGHLSNRFSVGTGIREDDSFLEVLYRPAYHDLLDNDRGYVEGSQILFTSLGFRYYFESARLKLQNFELVDIISLSPRDDFFKPVSWKVRTGLSQRLGSDGADQLIYDLTTGGGFSWKKEPFGLLYIMGEVEADLGGRSDEFYAIGTGGSAGVIRSMGDQWKFHLYARDIYYVLGDSYNALELSMKTDFTYRTNRSLRVGITWHRAYSVSNTEASLSWNIFF